MDTVIPTEILRENLHLYIKTPTVKVSQIDDTITLVPQPRKTNEQWGTKLCGMFSSPINMADDLVATRNLERHLTQ
ncbi:MAG: hypothetical protein FWG12_03865 [Holophagaceae bacterium]|nr:hypothetical protein [Holophagaceae bacterium]